MRDTFLAMAAALSLSFGGPAFAASRPLDDPPLTRDELVGLIDCSNRDAYGKMPAIAIGEAPAWMRRNETASSLSTYVYDLDRPIEVFGKARHQVVLYKGFVAVPLGDEEDVQHVVQTQALKRAPGRITRQYYRFMDPEVGPMLSVFELAVDPFSMLLGGDETRFVYAGCTDALTDEEGFVELATQADDLLRQMRGEVETLLPDGEPATSEAVP